MPKTALIAAVTFLWTVLSGASPGGAATPEELKRNAFQAIDRNADQIALIGDSLNREMMEKYRQEMRKFYLNRKVQFR